jgi:hypothetical protein
VASGGGVTLDSPTYRTVASDNIKETMMKATQFAPLLGAIFGYALVAHGFAEMLVVMLVAAVGWVVAAVLAGDVDVANLLERSSRQASRDRR